MRKPLVLMLMLSCILCLGQSSEEDKLKVFVDCWDCDITFIKQEMPYLSYVRDRLLSDVHIQTVRQSTGSGGREYTFMFYGRNDLKGYNDTLVVSTDANNTSDEVRRTQLKAIQLGLTSYLAKKGFFDDLQFNFQQKQEVVIEEDPWKKWVFRLSGSGWFNGEEQYSNLNTNAWFGADKVTEDWKIEIGLGYNRNISKFLIDNAWVRSETKNQWADANFIKSISDHWSVGMFNGAESSLFENYKLSLDAQPGIEYNLFPYKESSRQQLRVVYKVGPRYNVYNDSTIYLVNEELLGRQSLGIAFSMNKKWGSVSSSITGSNYFHDFDLNNLRIWNSVNLRVIKGLSINLSGSFSIIHDQINLPLGNYSDEEILLRQRQLQTGFRYWGNAGISYTFGSIYNSVVNPRFGN